MKLFDMMGQASQGSGTIQQVIILQADSVDLGDLPQEMPSVMPEVPLKLEGSDISFFLAWASEVKDIPGTVDEEGFCVIHVANELSGERAGMPRFKPNDHGHLSRY